ncbi:hypothetical protein EKH79_12595 [Dyella dinghuensis]|uniref:Uncharacterized protein n=1 Tax=Dyella dinghuensis TaxID=1920169 RepID=A0A432LRQ9_9GAMM|nr:hypothetical protein [Dyella dinghuensis]RUL63235.1 hypothetical protein EKH79_12595 [Dyella dinghuensis]
MTISSISSTQSQPVSGVVAPRYNHHKKELNAPTTAALVVQPGTSPTDASSLASAIAGAMAQLGLTPARGTTASSSENATSAKQFAPLSQPPQASQQVQQYKNVASTYSNLAQSLSSSSGSASAAASGTGSLTTVFENLWSSLGSSSETSADATGSTIPSLPLFLQTLARNFSESGVSGLRGVFVDTVA